VFWIRSIWGGLDSAIRISKQFKQQSKLKMGFFLQGLLLPLAFAIGGSKALLAHLAASAVAILLLETINFIEHYGLLRQKAGNNQFEPVKPHHSWDSHRYLTNSSLFNLGLHSHHHWKASVPFEGLRAMSAAPLLPYGYSVMFLIALIPPLWRRVMDPRVKALSPAEPNHQTVHHSA
jgi:alkane 1-monooxygenase